MGCGSAGRNWCKVAVRYQREWRIHGWLLPHLLAQDLHPTAVAGFLLAPQSELHVHGQPQSVRDWLLRGEPVRPNLDLIDVGQWAVR
jgi:hypothetical protein